MHVNQVLCVLVRFGVFVEWCFLLSFAACKFSVAFCFCVRRINQTSNCICYHRVWWESGKGLTTVSFFLLRNELILGWWDCADVKSKGNKCILNHMLWRWTVKQISQKEKRFQLAMTSLFLGHDGNSIEQLPNGQYGQTQKVPLNDITWYTIKLRTRCRTWSSGVVCMMHGRYV